MRNYPAGFYQLGRNDTDRVDIILDPKEKTLELEMGPGTLRNSVKILRSSENQRMWTYKEMSRTAQENLAAIRTERAEVSPLDTAALRSLERREYNVHDGMKRALDSLAGMVPDGQFAYAVGSDRAMDVAATEGPAALRRVFDLSDQRNLRSSGYPRAIMLMLQTTPMDGEFVLQRACDSILFAAASDTVCWNYTRYYLIEVFATYGPDDLAQYLVDQYVVGDSVLVAPDELTLEIAREQLRVAVGASAPDIELIDPIRTDTTMLSSLLPGQQFTGLFFYSSTCDHCHDQMPGLRRLAADMAAEDFRIIGIALDADLQEFKETLTEEQLTWSSYTALRGWADPAAAAFNVKATPSLFVLDRQGTIVSKPVDHETLRRFLSSGR